MLLLRLSGHSGAGKSRLLAALSQFGITCSIARLYTSRLPRQGEVHGRDYYFLSRSKIRALPKDRFYIGRVHEMLQAVDLEQISQDLKSNDLVIIDIFHALWPALERRIKERVGINLRTMSVFMTALDPDHLLSLPSVKDRGDHIQEEVASILTARGKDEPDKVKERSKSAVKQILDAIDPGQNVQYNKVFYSAPEGPDGKDDWTRETQPVGRAKKVLDEFIDFIKLSQIK
jgi:energy-coupling factor transporter ATP-binding protein EcfA2